MSSSLLSDHKTFISVLASCLCVQWRKCLAIHSIRYLDQILLQSFLNKCPTKRLYFCKTPLHCMEGWLCISSNVELIFIRPKSDHCLALSLRRSSCWILNKLFDFLKVVTYMDSCKLLEGFINGFLKVVEWVKILKALGPSCLWECVVPVSVFVFCTNYLWWVSPPSSECRRQRTSKRPSTRALSIWPT